MPSTTTVRFPEDIASACEKFTTASEDWSGTGADEAYAGALERIASGEAAGTRLEVPLREMAEGLRRGDASIPDLVRPICQGEAPTTLPAEAVDRRSRYLSAVRAAKPGITDGDNDLVEAIDAACDLLQLGDQGGTLPSSRDALLATAWAPLDEMDDAEYVLRYGVPLYCPQYQDLVEQLL